MLLAVYLAIFVFWLAGLIYLERRFATWPFALSGQFMIISFLGLIGLSLFHSLLFMLVLFWAIGISSLIKFKMLGLNMTGADFIALAPITFRTLISDFKIQTIVGVFAILSVVFIILMLPQPAGLPDFNWKEKLAAFSVAVVFFFALHFALNAKYRFTHHILRQNRAHFSAFVASLFGFGPSLKLQLEHCSNDDFSFSQPVSARILTPLPDIVVVMHETTFDPRPIGLALPEALEPFFSPPGAKTGLLHVDIFGGSTWQTEFSFYCGVSSKAFGTSASYVFQLLTDKIKTALPLAMLGKGWQTALISSDEKPLAVHENFYRSIGFERIDYPSQFIPNTDLARWTRERDDATTYQAALTVFDQPRQNDKPLLLSVMTYMNHATHKRQRFSDDRQRAIRDRAIELTGSKAYGEYCVRLAESQKARDEFMAKLAERAKTRPILVIHYGDHQATFVPEATQYSPVDPKVLTTFYSIEGLGLELNWPEGLPADLHVTYLAAIAQAAAGLPLDKITATLLDLARENSIKWDTVKTAAFYQNLVSEGLLTVT